MENWLEREELLLGSETVSRLKNANILVAGLGGVGGIAAEMLVRSGIGKLTVVDGDIVEDSNRNRQICALITTTGRKKTDVMAERFLDINPELELNIISDFLCAEEITGLIESGSFDAVLDAIDTLAPKTALIRAAVQKQIPVVSSMGSGAHFNPDRILCKPVMKTYSCPLAKAVRNGLRELTPEALKYCRAVFSEEQPLKHAVVDTGTMVCNKRAMQGTVSYMPALFGCHCAAEIIRIFIGESDL